MPSICDELTVRDLRRRWKPIKERLNDEQDSNPTAIRVHRAFSWMARVEGLEDGEDLDVALICRWVAFNALYGQWDEGKREPAPDFVSWQRFLGRILELDATSQLGNTLIAHRNLVLSILDDEYLSRFFWEEPSDVRARKSKKAKYDAQTWYLEKRWVMILDRLVERIYLMRCQLMHGAATFWGKTEPRIAGPLFRHARSLASSNFARADRPRSRRGLGDDVLSAAEVRSTR